MYFAPTQEGRARGGVVPFPRGESIARAPTERMVSPPAFRVLLK